MSEEEKAWKILKENSIGRGELIAVEDLKKILQLIEKQQKENEELRNKLDIAEKIMEEMTCELTTTGYLEDMCQMKQDNEQCNDCCNLCIQEYFRKKVSNE